MLKWPQAWSCATFACLYHFPFKEYPVLKLCVSSIWTWLSKLFLQCFHHLFISLFICSAVYLSSPFQNPPFDPASSLNSLLYSTAQSSQAAQAKSLGTILNTSSLFSLHLPYLIQPQIPFSDYSAAENNISTSTLMFQLNYGNSIPILVLFPLIPPTNYSSQSSQNNLFKA